MWDTITDLWRIARQLPESPLAKWIQLLSGLAVMGLAMAAVLSRAWKWCRGKGRDRNGADEWPEG